MSTILTMPPTPWIGLPEDEAYAWHVTLAGAIGLASQGITTELRWTDGTLAAVIGPPAPDGWSLCLVKDPDLGPA